MFINVSNHPSNNWSKKQYETAFQMGSVVDLAFPEVDPMMDSTQVFDLAQEYFAKIETLKTNNKLVTEDITVMVAGEFTFTFYLVKLLKQHNYKVVAACTKRETVEHQQEDGSVIKVAKFVFIQFREY